MSQSPHTTAPPPFVFVVMPFNPALRDVYDLGIKPAAEMAGAYAERVDEQHFTTAISERVLNQISRADAVVADMTGKNPNVLYEVGYAHALGKSVVMVTQDDFKDLPFDVNHFHHTAYKREDVKSLRDNLSPKIAAAISEADAGRRPSLPCPLEFRVDGFGIPEAGSAEPRGIPVRLTEPAHCHAAVKLSLCNVKSPETIQVDGIFLLAQPNSGVARWNAIQHEDAPDWLHGPNDGGGEYTRRFKIWKGGFAIPYFDVVSHTVSIHVPYPLPIVPMRFEVLAEGRRYHFDLLAQVPW